MDESPAGLRSRIQEFLNGSLLTVAGWTNGEGIPGSGLFLFGNDDAGRIYIRIERGSALERAVRDNPLLSLLVYREETDLEKIRSIAITGSATIEDNPESGTALHGYGCLRRKSPRIGQTPYQEDRDRYLLLVVTATEIRTRTYGEFLEGRPSSVLRRRSPGRS